MNFTGTLTNNGRIIADGGALDMSSFSAVANTVPNIANGSTNNGWFAKNGGELILPQIPVSSGGTYLWGADPSLVNSVQLNITGVISNGNLGIALYDPANSSVPNLSTLLAHSPDVVGVWDITTGFGFASLGASFRYDDVLAGSNVGACNCTNTWAAVGRRSPTRSISPPTPFLPAA